MSKSTVASGISAALNTNPIKHADLSALADALKQHANPAQFIAQDAAKYAAANAHFKGQREAYKAFRKGYGQSVSDAKIEGLCKGKRPDAAKATPEQIAAWELDSKLSEGSLEVYKSEAGWYALAVLEGKATPEKTPLRMLGVDTGKAIEGQTTVKALRDKRKADKAAKAAKAEADKAATEKATQDAVSGLAALLDKACAALVDKKATPSQLKAVIRDLVTVLDPARLAG